MPSGHPFFIAALLSLLFFQFALLFYTPSSSALPSARLFITKPAVSSFASSEDGWRLLLSSHTVYEECEKSLSLSATLLDRKENDVPHRRNPPGRTSPAWRYVPRRPSSRSSPACDALATRASPHSVHQKSSHFGVVDLRNLIEPLPGITSSYGVYFSCCIYYKYRDRKSQPSVPITCIENSSHRRLVASSGGEKRGSGKREAQCSSGRQHTITAPTYQAPRCCTLAVPRGTDSVRRTHFDERPSG